MVEKRLQKMQYIRNKSILPTLYGSIDYDTLLIGWGSTIHTIEEARKQLNDNTISFLHFSQVYPFHPKTETYLKTADRIITIENNATAQFAHILAEETGFSSDAHILQYTGHPFSVETLVQKIPETIQAMEGKK
jgi:2-oxoglutarate ferredoxin oxidoreductase subunit alpha